METTDTCGWEKKNQRGDGGGPINILIINENEKTKNCFKTKNYYAHRTHTEIAKCGNLEIFCLQYYGVRGFCTLNEYSSGDSLMT